MYSEWVSLSSTLQSNASGAQSQSVLNKFPASAGKEVAVNVVRQLASNLGITQNAEPSHLVKDEEVLWCMDVICYGLSLPLQEHETIKDCVNVYCEWMTALHPNPKICVPKPIIEDPNMYCRKIINHFHNLFVPRHGEIFTFLYLDYGTDVINRQTVLCHRVLRTLQQTAQISQIIERETWEVLLLFLLAINDILLAPPTVKDDVGDQLCERVLSVLFEVWLLACVRCFPSPSLWKTLQETCCNWRHRITLVEQWNRVNLILTARLLEFSYGSSFPELKVLEEDAQLIPAGMTNDCIAQTWYRFLRIIGSPVALCSPHLISKTQHFVQWSLMRNNGNNIEPYHHPCLLLLPQIFLKAIKGISSQVDAFLGIYQSQQHGDESTLELRATSESSGSHITSSGSSHFYFRDNYSFFNSIGGGSGGSHTASSSSTNAIGGSGGILNSFHFSAFAGAASAITGHHSNGTPITTTAALSSGHSIFDHNTPHSPTPPLQRRLAKSFSVAPSTSQQKGLSKAALIGLTTSRSSVHPPLTPNSGPPSSSSISSIPTILGEIRAPLANSRPKCNSILHLFGEWLFEAAHIGSDAWIQNTKRQATEASRRPSSMIMENRKGSISLSQPNSLIDYTKLPSDLTIDKYESGRAEAIGALCRIFCAKKTGEEILPVYLARFYMGLQQCLKVTESKEFDETLASILINSSDIFRLDLDGIQVLLPGFISALELILPEKNLKIKSQLMQVNKTELRRASINILLSILTLPLHFQTLPIRDLSNGPMDRMITFAQLKPRMINILMNALQVETDAQNNHMLLGGLLLTVQDAVAYEESEMGSNESMQTPSSPQVPETNLLSSACSEGGSSIASASNSSLGMQSTVTLGASIGAGRRDSSSHHDCPSLSISDDIPADLLHDFEVASLYADNAHALFVRATYLVCHRLISSWKTDLNVSLAALELLTGLARLHIRDSDALECKRAVKWICDYICYQCSRPPPAHSKDLHSTIVAAFQCTSAWLMQHPYLLQDKDCLNIVLEVVELGISGSKSIGKMGDTPKFKDEKELKPVSMRVRDAAENLLTIILEQVGYFPSECGPESVSSLLDETALVKHCNSVTTTDVTLEMAVQKFKYFVTENSTILALLEEPLGNDQDPQPTVTLLIRGPFGRHAWTMQLRHLPRSKSGTKYHAVNPGRPIPMNDQPQCLQLDQRFFPEIVDKIAPCVADYSIPTLDQIRDEYGSEQIKRLEQMLENQYVFEKLAWAETDNSLDGLSHAHEAVPPNICHEFQAARLFLSHFGFLSFDDSNKKESELVTSTNRLLTALDTKKQNFCYDLDLLDKLSPRTYDTVHVFYVKNGQSNCQEIIGNMNDDNIRMIDPHFWNMLQTLGWPVEIDEHSGWTGFVWNSWALKSATKSGQNDHSKRSGASGLFDMRFNGESRVLYWADVSSEIAFVVPTEWNGRQENTDGNCSSWNSSVGNESINSSAQSNSSVWYDNKSDSSSTSEQSLKPSANQKPRTLSLDIDKAKEPIPPARKRTGVLKSTIQAQSSAKIFLVWLESFEDHINFPIDGLLPYTRTGEESQTGQIIRSSDCHIIFLHALQSGLLRVKLQGPVGRMSFATPLVDGMVLSRRVVGNLVRQTAFNMSKRRRLDNDSYQPPHVRRRLKVQDIVQKYKIELTEPELLAHLFANS
ncbi:ral GTPase-activating protein subunit beta isoform X3 [Condylostylus longicornis]|uniref:ral GTPase-activating protein subunit beta isoform X3 n=1 Tax=Condylostylus longicornis TaxID=2530218 RepID=UPI00244DBB50|nr:ral GTPase-activating protein subunit beta isoform X3 [Condylostylus longicornis]